MSCSSKVATVLFSWLLNKYIFKMTAQVRAASWMINIKADQESAS